MILDGYGISFNQEGNAILAANMESMNKYLRERPSAVIKASGIEVGLPWGEVGNSETGHKNMGSGRIIYQALPQITLSIRDETFFNNPAFLGAAGHVKQNKSAALHIMGCLSNGGVHSHIDHLIALLDFARRQNLGDRTFIHVFLDGRDVPPVSAGQYLTQVEKEMKRTQAGTIASIIGRFYAMDRNNNWDRTKEAYELLVHGTGKAFPTWNAALEAVYEEKKTDEVASPAIIARPDGSPVRTIQNDDAIIFFNFRPDRARQLSSAFVRKDFSAFPVERFDNIEFVTMAEVEEDLPATIAFPEEHAEFPVGRVVSDAGLRQLRIAETEKYAHVTYYFNSGRELPYPGEDRAVIPSPNVKNYATTPKMSAEAITDRLVQEIQSGKYDFIVLNYANPDMIAHTGDYDATVEALKFLDGQITRAVDATLGAGGAVVITCDHGNAEDLISPQTHKATTDHSSNPVPLIYIAKDNAQASPKGDDMLFQVISNPIGVLADIGPTCLDILGLQQPPQMTGQSLLKSLV